MAIGKKPVREAARDVTAFINAADQDEIPDKPGRHPVMIRLAPHLLEKLDAFKQRQGISRSDAISIILAEKLLGKE